MLLKRRDEFAGHERGDDRLAPIAHLTLYERVYEELRNAIMAGAFASGETLTIRSLAQQLGTSAMPAREALRRLATEGAVEVLPNRSIRIPELDVEHVAEVCRLRILLESEAAFRAAQRITPPELQTLRAAHRSFVAAVKAGAVPKFLLAGQLFHFTIYEAARAPTTLSIIGMLWLQSGPWLAGPMRRLFSKREFRSFAEGVAAHHQALLDAIEAGDADRAAAAVRGELEAAAAHMRATFGETAQAAPSAA